MSILDEFGRPMQPTVEVVPVETTDRDITLELITKPSSIVGFNYWVTLTYRTHTFEEMLPKEFAGWSDETKDARIEQAAQRLKNQLRPILMAEDRRARLTLLPNEQAHVPLTEHEI